MSKPFRFAPLFGFLTLIGAASGYADGAADAILWRQFAPAGVEPAFIEFYQEQDELYVGSVQIFQWTAKIPMPNGKIETLYCNSAGTVFPRTPISVAPGAYDIEIQLGSFVEIVKVEALPGRTTLVNFVVRTDSSHSTSSSIVYSFRGKVVVDGDFPRASGTANRNYLEFVDLLSDERPGVRLYAVRELGYARVKESLPHLESALQKEKKPAIQKYLSKAIKNIERSRGTRPVTQRRTEDE